ncbi:hypothetical protein L596_006644 [Steinernema carpocapsae]|uniref:Uncharacterized protein n=1 Tax=Steinernema carpocapsae TaxID=34508 RepID=A0A4U8V2P7_STECR|nr:hypothetical protein L596_006644 [Steinernema carpocapsae]
MVKFVPLDLKHVLLPPVLYDVLSKKEQKTTLRSISTAEDIVRNLKILITNDNWFYAHWNLQRVSKTRAIMPSILPMPGAFGLAKLFNCSSLTKLVTTVSAVLLPWEPFL